MRWLRLINKYHRQSRERGIWTFFSLSALLYLWNIVMCAEGGQIFPHTRETSYDFCEISFTNTGHLQARLIQDNVLLRFSATVLLRDNLINIIGQILLQCLEQDIRISFEILHDALRSRHISVYEILPILPISRGKSVKEQIYTVLQIIERMGSPFVSGYASLAKAFVDDDRIELNSAMLNDLLWSMDNQTITAISLDKKQKFNVPMTEEEAFAAVMTGLRNGRISINLSIVSTLMINIPNFDTTNPEVPETLRFVANFMNAESKSNDSIFDFLTIDKLESPDVLVKTVLERLEVSSDVLRESVGILLQSFDRKPWDRGVKINWAKRRFSKDTFDSVTIDYYPRPIVAIASYLKSKQHEKDSLNIETTFYDRDIEVTTEFLARFLKRGEATGRLYKLSNHLLTFVTRRSTCDNDFFTSEKSVSFHEVSRYLSAFDVPCVPKKLKRAAEYLRSIVTEDLPWAFAFGQKSASGNPWKIMVNALVKLRNTPVKKELAVASDNLIFQAQSSGLLGKQSVLYEDGVIFQRADSFDVELDIYSLLSHLPNVFSDDRLMPLLVFATKTNLLDYLGHEFNKFEHSHPRKMLFGLLKRTSEISAVRSSKSLLRAVNIAKNQLEKPLLSNLYTSEELRNLLRIFPKIHEDPRYLPLRMLFERKRLFKYLSPEFSLANLNSSVERMKFILSTVALKPIEFLLTESIYFALSNLEGPPLPARNFTRQDFVYLVNQLLSNHSKMAILQSPLYNDVVNWHPALENSPQIILERILNYPTEELRANLTLGKIVREAEVSLNVHESKKLNLLKSKTLNAILEEMPDDLDSRIIKLLLKKPDLTIFMPKLNITKLDNLTPRAALKKLLKNLAISRYLKSKRLFSKRMNSVLKTLEKSNGDRKNVASCLKEMLIDPFNPHFEPLMRELRKKRCHGLTSTEKLKKLQNFLNNYREKLSRTSILRRSARIAIAQVFAYENDYVSKKRRIDNAKIKEALDLLPKQTELEPLRKLLTINWILRILPESRVSNFRKPSELLRAILTFTKENHQVRKNPLILTTISLAKQTLGDSKPDITELRRFIVTVETAIYDPIIKLLTAKNLNKMNITYRMNSEGSTKRKLLELLDQIISNRRTQRDKKVLQLLEAVRNDVITLGVDIDLLSVLDDVGVAYEPELAPLRLFLHRNDVAQILGPLVFRHYDTIKRFFILLKLLVRNPDVRSDEMLKKAVTFLKNIDIDTTKSSNIRIDEFVDTVKLIPHIKIKYPEIQELFTKNMIKVAKDNEILRSETPLKSSLNKISRLSDAMRNHSVVAELVPMYEEVNSLIEIPFATDFQIKPFVTKLRHVRQMKIDLIDKLVVPEVPFINLTDPDDNLAVMNAVVQIALLRDSVKSELVFKNTLLTFRNDLALIAGTQKASKGKLSDTVIEKILKLIPPEVVYDPVSYFIESRKIFEFSKEINWQRYRTSREKLDVILIIIENNFSGNVQVESLMQLRRYLASQFDFVGKKEWRLLKNELHGVSGNFDLVPLKLFLTQENLIKYIPKNISYSSHRLPREELIDILDKLRRIPNLRRQESLYKALKNTQRILRGNELINREGKAVISRLLKPRHLRFVSALEINNPEVKSLLDPKNMIRLLPNDTEIMEQTTFKNKAVFLLRRLMMIDKKFRKKLPELLRYVESLPDVPFITDEELRPLIEIIPQETSVKSVRRLLRGSILTRLLPGNFNVRSFNDSKSALKEVLKILQLTMHEKRRNFDKPISVLLQELNKNTSKILLEKPRISLEELNSSIFELPFDKKFGLQEMKKNFTADMIHQLLPREFDVNEFPTKKSILIGIFDAILERPLAAEFEKLIKITMNLISAKPDAPRIHEDDVKQAFSKLPLSRKNLETLTAYCTVEKLGPRLPIDFNISRLNSRKQKISALIKYCEETEPLKKDIKNAIANAKNLTKKLPTTDLTDLEVNKMIDQIGCGNFSVSKPLKIFLSKEKIVHLLPWNLNLENKTSSQRIDYVLKALLKVGKLKSRKYNKALNDLEIKLKKMPKVARISENDVTSLHNHEFMRDNRSKLCSEFLTLSNVLKFLPFTFDIKKFPNENSRLSALLFHLNNTQLRNDEAVYNSCKFIDESLSHKMKNTILDSLKDLANDNAEYSALKFLLLSNDKIFDPASIPRGYENENFNDTLRITLRNLLKTDRVLRSKTLRDSIVSLFGTLPNFYITKFDVDEARAEIPKSNKYEAVEILLRCSNVRDNLHDSSSVPSEFTTKRLLLHILENLQDFMLLDNETLKAVEELRSVVKLEVSDEEVQELFRQFKDHRIHIAKLEALRSFLVSEGPAKFLGQDYRENYPNKFERLKILCKKLSALPHKSKNNELQKSLEYLKKVLENETSIVKKPRRPIEEIDLKSLLIALPKTRNERLIVGFLKFFSNPQLLKDLELKNPYDYKTKGALLKAIVLRGRNLKSVKRDRLQSDALNYFKDKIMTKRRGKEPIELKNYAVNSNLDVDILGLFKALNPKKLNVTVAARMARFFETKYDQLLHGVGFDQAAYLTRGSYLKAFLHHLAGNSAVPREVRLDAELLLPAVTLDGFGARPVDENESINPDKRIFVEQSVSSPQSQQFSVVSSGNLPVTLKSDYSKSVDLPDALKSNRTMLKASLKSGDKNL